MAKVDKQKILKKIRNAQMRNDLPAFKAGDTISVSYRVFEGKKARIQTFTGVCLRIKGAANSKTFLLRKENGVEKLFPLHSPQIAKIVVEKKGKVRRAYISYMRKRSGKSARIADANK